MRAGAENWQKKEQKWKKEKLFASIS